MHGRLVAQPERPAADAEVPAVGADVDGAGRERSTVHRESHAKLGERVEPPRELRLEPRGDVLHHEERMGSSGGSFARMLASAAGPPVDAAMASTSIPRRRAAR